MPKDQLKKVIESYITENNTCALATGTGDYIRCTPLEYSYRDGKFWIFSEGGEKFIGLEKNENVCLAVFDKYQGFANLKSIQVMGKARIIEPFSEEYILQAQYKKIPIEALKKLNPPMHLICVTPWKIEALFADLKKEGYDSRQTYEVNDTPEILAAKEEDLPQILQIYAYARKFMKETGNPNQWKNTAPTEEELKKDIKAGNLYVIRDTHRIHAVFAFIIGEDPTYARIEQGCWKSDKSYGTIHRVASDGTQRGIFEMVVNYCLDRIPHLRVDTHEDNKVMQHLILKNGFERRGIIYVADGTPRIAYELEKIIKA